jgi:ATP-dependent helicase HrpA
LVNDDTLVRWFAERIADDITTVRHFDRWWRDTKTTQPELLELHLADLIDPDAEQTDPEAYPTVWEYGDLGLPLEYEFDPASPADGLTIDVPLRGLGRIDPALFEWHIPGMRLELVTALIRSLPKHLRKAFAPVPDTARSVLDQLDPNDNTGLLFPLRRELSRIGGLPIPVDAFDPSLLPAHLRPVFRIIDDDGQMVAEGEDLVLLKEEVRDETESAVGGSTHELETTGLTAWSIGELPHTVEITGTGRTMEAYPALVDEGTSVAVRLLATEAERDAAMWQGTIRLLLLSMPSPGKLLRPLITPDTKIALRSGPHENQTDWMEDCLGSALGEIITAAGGPAWDAVEFDRLLLRARDELHPRVTKIATESVAVLEALRILEVAFNRSAVQRYEDALQDIANQVAALVYPGFLTAVGSERLTDVRRYLEAATRRIDRLPGDAARDELRMAQVHDLEAELERLESALPGESRLMDVAWMIQELRVSLFAQALGTKGKVSEKRIRSLLTEIEMHPSGEQRGSG